MKPAAFLLGKDNVLSQATLATIRKLTVGEERASRKIFTHIQNLQSLKIIHDRLSLK